MGAERGVEALPEFGVLDLFFGGGLPAIAFPARDPLGDSILHVSGIRKEAHFAGAFERFERFDGGGQLHAVVGGLRGTALHLFLDIAVSQYGAPAARPRIAATGSVSEDVNAAHAGSIPYSRAESTVRWNLSLLRYSSGSLRLTSAPSGVLSQS